MRRKGIWRLWFVASVAWAAYLAWQSDLACPLNLLGVETPSGPWCEFQNAEPLNYYGNLLLRMLGVPVIAALGIIAAAWVIDGFSAENSN
jgi:hypothetical protein